MLLNVLGVTKPLEALVQHNLTTSYSTNSLFSELFKEISRVMLGVSVCVRLCRGNFGSVLKILMGNLQNLPKAESTRNKK